MPILLGELLGLRGGNTRWELRLIEPHDCAQPRRHAPPSRTARKRQRSDRATRRTTRELGDLEVAVLAAHEHRRRVVRRARVDLAPASSQSRHAQREPRTQPRTAASRPLWTSSAARRRRLRRGGARALGRVGEAVRSSGVRPTRRSPTGSPLPEQHPRADAPARARDAERGLVVAPARRVEQHVGAAVEEQAEDLPVVHHREHHMVICTPPAAAPTPPPVRPESYRDVGEEFRTAGRWT